MAGTWKTFATPKVGSTNLVADTMLLLHDGSVLIHQTQGAAWMRLSPDANGNYATGSWSGPFNTANTRQFFASGVTADGRVYVIGGEVSNAGANTPLAEISNPVNNIGWTPLSKPATFAYISGDVASSGLADGRVLLGSLLTAQSAIWNPANGAWVEAGKAFGTTNNESKDGVTNEETWTLLPDGSVLTVETKPSPTNPTANPAERYLPASDTWVSARGTPQNLVIANIFDPATNANVLVSEIGPALLLPGGKVFAIGATGHTAIYDPVANTWSKGPDFPADTSGQTWNAPNGNIQTAIDAPAALLPGGQVLCVAGNTARQLINNKVGFWSSPMIFYEYDPAKPQNGLTALTNQPPANSTVNNITANDTWTARLLLLPNGDVLLTSQQPTMAIYTPSANELQPQDSWRPVVSEIWSLPGGVFRIDGSQLNGLSQAVSYGDDAQMATNRPLVRITTVPGNKVYYCPTFGHSTMGVAPGPALHSTRFTVPAGVPGRTSYPGGSGEWYCFQTGLCRDTAGCTAAAH
jgi:hypothetical protein